MVDWRVVLLKLEAGDVKVAVGLVEGSKLLLTVSRRDAPFLTGIACAADMFAVG